MKKLLLIRHAEAETHAGSDFIRPLSAKGKMDAARLAQKLQTEGLLPQLFISSPSLRTTTTAAIITRQLQLPQAQLNLAIYEASEKALLKVINHINDTHDFAAMVGHNPGIAYLLLNLTGKVRDVPPCTAILVVFEEVNSWYEITHESGVITYYNTPQHA